MHTSSRIYNKTLFPPALPWMQPAKPILPMVNGTQLRPFHRACICSWQDSMPCLGRIALVLQSLPGDLSSKFIAQRLSLMKNFDLYFSKRWSFIFPDTCLTWRRLCESYSSNWSPKFFCIGFSRDSAPPLRFQ